MDENNNDCCRRVPSNDNIFSVKTCYYSLFRLMEEEQISMEWWSGEGKTELRKTLVC